MKSLGNKIARSINQAAPSGLGGIVTLREPSEQDLSIANPIRSESLPSNAIGEIAADNLPAAKIAAITVIVLISRYPAKYVSG